MQKPIDPGNRPLGRPNPPVIVNRPEINRPQINRPINIGSNNNNTIINNRPVWVNINNTQINTINNRWQTAINVRPANPAIGLHNWGRYHPNRVSYWNGWANGVRAHWRWHGHHSSWFAGTWWERYPHRFCGWHYHHHFHLHPWRYWWTVPVWTTVTRWFTWPPPPLTVWEQPIYYDYGRGGNVVYQDNRVYIAGNQVATAEEFAQSAAALATVPPPASDEEAKKAEWMPLGTFALAAGEKDLEPSRILQLAVDKQGIVAGTLFNQQTEKAFSVQGRVDKETQRVALRFGDSETIVAETGLYNLTQEEAPLLVHFGSEKVENYLLIRLNYTESGEQAAEGAPGR